MTGHRTETSEPGAAPSSGDKLVPDLADLLVTSLETLANAGQADAACRQAGKACAALRVSSPAQWRKFNALLHRLSRQAPLDDS